MQQLEYMKQKMIQVHPYYFRANIANNYVKISGSLSPETYWRILRINGDGSIRLVYHGTEAYPNDSESKYNILLNVSYNENISDNAFIVYMNGTVDGTHFPSCGTNSISYAEAHANCSNRDVKMLLDYL